ncbi:Dabb family protein [Maribacter sp. 2-571]|uniref:Dabb family protein n=1 Tax=Maribacter sp. 2-571 TaxID=3417569 RepID=UPI003D338B39
MRPQTVAAVLFTALCSLTLMALGQNQIDTGKTTFMMEQDSLLRHVVLFKFKEGTSDAKILEIATAFKELPAKIPEIKAFEWGTNNSPEGLDKGFTHCFFLTFATEADRAIYLPHPDHKAFGGLLNPYLEDVLVTDYWVRQ